MEDIYKNTDIPKYCKKKKVSSNAKKRSDHKHEYEKIIISEILFGYNWGKRCKICGRTEKNFGSNHDFMHEKAPHVYFPLSETEIHLKYPDYKIYKSIYDDKYKIAGYEEFKI